MHHPQCQERRALPRSEALAPTPPVSQVQWLSSGWSREAEGTTSSWRLVWGHCSGESGPGEDWTYTLVQPIRNSSRFSARGLWRVTNFRYHLNAVSKLYLALRHSTHPRATSSDDSRASLQTGHPYSKWPGSVFRGRGGGRSVRRGQPSRWYTM